MLRSIMKNITPEILLAAGFRKYHSGRGDNVVAMFQKRIVGDDGRTLLHTVEVYQYDFSGTNIPVTVQDHYSFSFEARMYVSTLISFDLNLMAEPELSIDDVLKFYSDAYVRMGCCPDLHNN